MRANQLEGEREMEGFLDRAKIEERKNRNQQTHEHLTPMYSIRLRTPLTHIHLLSEYNTKQIYDIESFEVITQKHSTVGPDKSQQACKDFFFPT